MGLSPRSPSTASPPSAPTWPPTPTSTPAPPALPCAKPSSPPGPEASDDDQARHPLGHRAHCGGVRFLGVAARPLPARQPRPPPPHPPAPAAAPRQRLRPPRQPVAALGTAGHAPPLSPDPAEPPAALPDRRPSRAL